MKALVYSLLTIIMAWTSTLAHSDGRYLLERCEAALAFTANPENPQYQDEMAYCYGLLQGVRDTNRLYEAKIPGDTYFCLGPQRLGHSDTAQLVVDYLRRHPQRLHQNESVLVVQALRAAYPCLEDATLGR